VFRFLIALKLVFIEKFITFHYDDFDSNNEYSLNFDCFLTLE
jgi:hypothetical protein